MPSNGVRDTLGDFVNQYSGYAQTTTTLGLAGGVPRARRWPTRSRPWQPGHRALLQSGLRPLHEPRTRESASISASCVRRSTSRFNLSFQRKIWFGDHRRRELLSSISVRQVPYDINLNQMDPAFKYEQKTVITAQVTNPFRNYLTVDKFPGALRNSSTVSLDSLPGALPQCRRSRRPTRTAARCGRIRSSSGCRSRSPGAELPRLLRLQQREAAGVV